MMDKGLKVLGFGIFLLAIVIMMSGFVSGAKAPTNLVFGLNTTANFDGLNGTHGVFYLNWTNHTVDSTYNVYITTNGTDFTGATFAKLANTSGAVGTAKAGLLYYNLTEANYTFIVEATDGTNSTNSSAVSMTIDGTGPSTIKIWWSSTPTYSATNTSIVNASATNRAYNTSTTLNLNIYASDADSGLTGSRCLISINSTNAINESSIAISNGWCNSTSIPLTGNEDGARLLQIYVNDTVNNFAMNNSPHNLYIEMDSTNPTAGASCSDVTSGDSFPCSCSATDSQSGANSSKQTTSSTSSDGTSTPELTGSFTYTCTVYDYAGNVDSATASYTVEGVSNSGSSSGSSSSGAATWATHAISKEVFQNGYTAQIQANKRIRVEVNNEYHHVGVVSVGTDKVTIEIASDPVTVNLAVGEDAKIDVDDDGYYDIYVILNAIVDGDADVTIKEIHEETPAEEEGGVTTTGQVEREEETPAEEEGSSLMWLWIVIGVIIIIAVGFGIAKKKK